MKRIRNFLGTPNMFVIVLFLAAAATSYGIGHSGSGANASSGVKIYQVALEADRARPDAVQVNIGDSVQFNSKDGKSHSLGQGKGGTEHQHTAEAPLTGRFKADEGYRQQFKELGVYNFHDHENPKINIAVVVYDPNKK